MGNLILNLLSLDHKWAAWLAKCRFVNYSTAFYYRFSFVLCCSSWHWTLVWDRTALLSQHSSACVALKTLQSHKRAVLLSLKLLCSLSHPWLQTEPQWTWSVPQPGVCEVKSMLALHTLYEFLVGVFCLFSLGNRILTLVGCQETSWIRLREIHSQVRHSSINSSFKACVVTRCVLQCWRILSLYPCPLSL